MLIRPTAFTIGLIIYSFITLFVVYTEFGIDSYNPTVGGTDFRPDKYIEMYTDVLNDPIFGK